MGLFGGSTSKQSSTTNTQIDERNTNLSDVSGIGLSGVEGNVNLTVTDGGTVRQALETVDNASREAVSRAADLAADVVYENRLTAQNAFALSDSVVSGALGLGNNAVREVSNLASDALAYGGASTDFAGAVVDKSLSTTRSAYEDALGFGAGVTDDSLAFASDTFTRAIGAVTDTVHSLQASQAGALEQINASTRSDTAETLQTLIKYAGYAVMAMAALMLVARSK